MFRLNKLPDEMALIEYGMYAHTRDDDEFMLFLEGDGGDGGIFHSSKYGIKGDDLFPPFVLGPVEQEREQGIPNQKPAQETLSMVEEPCSESETQQRLEDIAEVSQPQSDTDEDPKSSSDESISNPSYAVQRTDENAYLKNFMVLLSGWIKSYLFSLNTHPLYEEIKSRFQNIACPTSQSKGKKKSKAAGRKKVYINLKKLTLIFRDEVLKPLMSQFLDKHFLRRLSISTTKNRSCLIRFLPVLKQGLINGRITRLR